MGKSYNTAKFATESIRQWWNIIGKYHYAECKKLLFCADGGGSNGSRSHQDRQRKNKVDSILIDCREAINELAIFIRFFPGKRCSYSRVKSPKKL